MDPIDFIDSGDVRAHLREIEYRPNSIEAAFLIWQSSKKTLDEKHDAWNWLVGNMPDMTVPERNGIGGWGSLHEMLKSYMFIEDGLIERLKDASPDHVYNAEVRGIIRCGLARSFKGCYMGALTMIGNNAGGGMNGLYGGEFYVDKLPIASDGLRFGPDIHAVFDLHGRLMDIDGSLYDAKGNSYAWLNGMDPSIKNYSFGLMWFDFPVPFERGDIVRSTVDGSYFVLEETAPWLYAKRDAERKAEGQKELASDVAESTHMVAWGSSADNLLAQMKAGSAVDAREGCLKIERVADELSGRDRILYAYSALLKGKLSYSDFLQYARSILRECGNDNTKGPIALIEEAVGIG